MNNTSATLPSHKSVSENPIRVLIADDSAIIRGFMSRALRSEADIEVVATAGNGELAIAALKLHPIDVIILDIEMPVMDGLTAIPHLKKVDPAVQIIMASTLTQKNAEVSLKALSLGATDYIPKPSSDGDINDRAQEFNRDLADRVRTLGNIARRKNVRTVGTAPKSFTVVAEKKKIELRTDPIVRPDIIAIGSSTGGPQALFDVIKALGNGLKQPVVITQHMPASFTKILAEHISRQCNVTCSEAQQDELVSQGKYYIAPGDYHMLVEKRASGAAFKLTKDPQENYCRPSVDPMLRSLVNVYGKKLLTVILTGMGQDGLKGCQNVISAGGSVIAQDEATSAVWGMPGAVANAGLCSSVLPLSAVGPAIRQIAMRDGP